MAGVRVQAEKRLTRADLPWGVAAVVLSCVGAFLALQLWNADLRMPFSYGGDGVYNQLIVKTVLDHGWYQHNPDLGAPFGMKLYDFAVVSGDNLQIVLMKAIGIFSSDSALVENLFFLLTVPLAAGSAFVCMRILGLTAPCATAMATLFALLPAHFVQGEAHVFIAAYYAVPIGAVLAVRAADPAPLALRRKGTLAWLIPACVVVGSAHVYYAAFALTMIAAAGICRLAAGPRRSAATALVLLVGVGGVVVLNHLPNAIYQHQHGRNEALVRPASETEFYGLKVVQMVFPVEHHRLKPLAHLRARYDQDGTQIQEGDPQALGAIATLGLAGLVFVTLAALFTTAGRIAPPRVVYAMAGFVLVAVLVGTVGGFSAVFSYLVSSQLRAWGRISVFIAFFGLAAVGFAVQWLAARRAHRELIAALAALVVIGFLDQTNAASAPNYSQIKDDYGSDAALVGQIEARLPRGAAVFELPYEPFPEPQPQWIPGAGPYDLGRGYLHSHDLRWSYGLMKGRAGDWQAALVQLPPALVARAVTAAGFSGIYVDRAAFADDAKHLLSGLIDETQARPLASRNGRIAFLDIRAYAQRLRSERSPGELVHLRDATLQPVTPIFGAGFFKLEQDLQARSYRLSAQGELVLQNAQSHARQVRVVLTLEPAFPATAHVSLRYPNGSVETVTVPRRGVSIDREMTIPPGFTAIGMKVAGHPQLGYPTDTQPYYLRVLDPLVVDRAFAPFGPIPADRRAAAWLQPFGTI